MSKAKMLNAQDIMTRTLITLRPDMSMANAIKALLQKRISGAPVVNERGKLVGMLSELDCLQILAVDEYNEEMYNDTQTVAEFMTEVDHTIPPTLGIYSIADLMLTKRIRRLPVVERDTLVGLVSRRDVLHGIARMMRERRRPDRSSERDPNLYLSATDTDPGVIGTRLK